MKKLLLAAACVAISAGAWAQGTVLFSNSAATLGTAQPILGIDGVGLTGTGFLAQLWAGPNEASLAPIGDALSFRPTGTKGILLNSSPDRVIASVAGGAAAVCQIRAWDAAGGATWDAGSKFEGGSSGMSATFTVTTGGGGVPPGPPAALTGFQGFKLTANPVTPIVPEPSTLALGALGLGALLWRRRS